ncbi:MAG: YbjQ family protein [Clostridia bacterium]|nr:YbjQ family protein [Clostridia bacterium]
MLLTSTEVLPDREISETLGLVQGQVVKAKHIGKDIMAGFKNIIGGEVKGYTEMLSEARQIATDRMIEEAKKLGADAIIGVRYGSSEAMEGATEMLAYGTAVKLK